MDQMIGGWGETMDATEDTQRICDEVKGQAEKITDRCYKEFKAVKYRFQVVGGYNYVIKVQVGEKDYIQLNVFQPLPCHGGKVVLHKVLQNRTKDDLIIPF